MAASRRDFARNTLLLVQPAASQLVLRSLKDLTLPAVTRVAIGNPASVPVGRYAQDALEAAKLWPQVNAKAVNTLNVRQSLDYVARGEVDAGFVYATDAALVPGKVDGRLPRAVAAEHPLPRLPPVPARPTLAKPAALSPSSCRRPGRPSWRVTAF